MSSTTFGLILAMSLKASANRINILRGMFTLPGQVILSKMIFFVLNYSYAINYVQFPQALFFSKSSVYAKLCVDKAFL